MAATRKRTRYSCQDAVNIIMNDSDSDVSDSEMDSGDDFVDNESSHSQENDSYLSEPSDLESSDEFDPQGEVWMGQKRFRGRGRGRGRGNRARGRQRVRPLTARRQQPADPPLEHVPDNGADRPERGDQNYDKLWKIRPLMDLCESQYLAVCNPSRDLCIDESIIRFKGRIEFKQYLPSKPYKWGIKQFALCDSKTGFAYRFLTYCGKGTIIPKDDFSITESVCLHLLEGFENKGHRVFLDNFYTSPKLVRELERLGIGACGTVKPGRQYMPKELKQKTLHLYKGDDPVFMRANNLVTCAWHDTKSVHFLSNFHTNSTIDKHVRTKHEAGRRLVEKPLMAEIYSSNMGGVDLFDQKLQTFVYPHKTQKWYLTIYNRLRETALVNAYIIYKQMNHGTCLKPKQFREKVIDELLDGFQREDTRRGRPSNIDKTSRLVERHFVGQFLDKRYLPDCVVCSDRSRPGWKRKQTHFNCEQCGLAMCPYPCHKLYHTEKNYKSAAGRIVYNL